MVSGILPFYLCSILVRIANERTIEEYVFLCYSLPMSKEKKVKAAVVDEYFERLAEAAEEKKEQPNWLNGDYHGQLAIDVFQPADDLVIRAAIAGVQRIVW